MKVHLTIILYLKISLEEIDCERRELLRILLSHHLQQSKEKKKLMLIVLLTWIVVLNDGIYFRILDPLDLVRFSVADINFLLVNPIRLDEEDEEVAKGFIRKASHFLAKKTVANYNRIAGIEAAAEPDEVDPNEDNV
jgi:hypothetical protein